MSRFDNIHEYDNSLAGAGLRIGIVMSRFNLPVCEGLLSSSVAELKRLGVAEGDMEIANGILTCETDEQAEVRMREKGRDCAQAAVEMANLHKALAQ